MHASRTVVSLTVNGATVVEEVEPRLLLCYLLRDRLGLKGTHIGCETSLCGACTVVVDGLAVKSCTRLAVQCEGQAITTIEGFERDGVLHPMQEAFREHHALQCGYCTPGMIVTSCELVATGAAADEASVRDGLNGNLCRCTGYQHIVDAVLAAGRAAAQGAGR